MEKIRSLYAIPCVFSSLGDYDPRDVFFLTFTTKDEKEALKLASCVCGKKKAGKSLVIITEKGDIIPT